MISSATRIEGGPQSIPASVRKTVQSIKEIVGNHSDTDIYWALKESNMDPNETAQKLLNQAPFHEVKRKRDKKKESAENDNATDQRRHSGFVAPPSKVNPHVDRNVRRGGHSRVAAPANSGVSREFRVVRDNRVNHNANRENKPASVASAALAAENVSGKGSTGSAKTEDPIAGKIPFQTSNGLSDSPVRAVQHSDSTGFVRKEVQPGKASNARSSHPAVASSNNSAVGVYSSSMDPVHVPSPDNRSSASVGAIKREVGVVGVRRQSSDNSKSSMPSSSAFSTSLVREQGSSESFRSFTNVSKHDGPNQTSESTMPSVSVGRSLLGGHYNSRQQHHQAQKASQPNKEWKPKSSQKPRSPGVIGTPAKSVPPPANEPKESESEVAKVEDKVSRVSLHETQNVIIAQHIRVPETDRCRLTFGSFGKDFDPSRDLVNGISGALEESNGEITASLSTPDSAVEDATSGKHVDLIDDKVRNSGSSSPPSGAVSENQLPEKKESSSPRDLNNYADIGLVQDNSQSYDPSESQQQEHADLPGFSAYDLQPGYDIPYFRPSMDETMRQGLQTPHEAMTSHNVNNVPSSTMAMVQHQQQQQQQQQQAAVAQMYPQQVHLSHYANLMPYRQFLSPVYVPPPMAMSGYSGNPPYPHPSGANSFLLMPPGGTHLNANGLKYGVQPFKPVPAATPTGFGGFSNPNGYTMTTPGVVGGAPGMDDSSRLKYKDGNLYIPNPQAETSEIWIQNPRDLQGMQSAPYYNMAGQSPHAAAYIPSHSPHAASSHMQFPGMYHPPPQPAGMANHHMGPGGVAATAPGPQGYQQAPLGHLNWTSNF